MAPRKMPSILKRQKEAQRAAKASQKREARQSRNQARAAEGTGEFGQPIESPDQSKDAGGGESGG